MYGFPTLLNDLENRFSIIQRKSLVLQPPRITNEDDVRNFIRGVFDGERSGFNL